jgi:hypothetical protein
VPFFDFGHRIFIIFVRGENLNRTIFVEQEVFLEVNVINHISVSFDHTRRYTGDVISTPAQNDFCQ